MAPLAHPESGRQIGKKNAGRKPGASVSLRMGPVGHLADSGQLVDSFVYRLRNPVHIDGRPIRRGGIGLIVRQVSRAQTGDYLQKTSRAGVDLDPGAGVAPALKCLADARRREKAAYGRLTIARSLLSLLPSLLLWL